MAQSYTSSNIPQLKPDRDSLPKGSNLCQYCTGKCCRYFAMAIDTPTDWEDFENMRWYLLHEHAAVFVEDKSWYLLVTTKCKNLGDDNYCKNYEHRPAVCRIYSTDRCEYEDNWVYDHLFDDSEQVYEYALAVLGPKEGTDIRSPQPSK